MRKLKQRENENFDDFVARIRTQANRCSFVDTDDAIIDQIIEGCASRTLRKKLLKDDLNIGQVVAEGKMEENIDTQDRAYANPKPSFEVVQQIQRGSKRPMKDFRCLNCNREGHMAREIDKCPAKNIKCHLCSRIGHYKICCPDRRNDRSNAREPPPKQIKRENLHMNRVESSEPESSSALLAFVVGGVKIKMLVDSGSPANIVTAATFEHLKRSGAAILNEKSGEQNSMYTGYASDAPISFSRIFEVEIKVPGEETGIFSYIFVAPRGQTNILSHSTAFALGVIKIGYNINAVTEKKTEAKIKVDKNVKPMCQPLRRLPVAMEAEVESQIQKLLEQGIIEPVDEPAEWVSPLVPVRKHNGQLRLCIDLRAVNKAILPDNFPMSHIEEALATIGRAEVFSTVDLESAYYLLELDEDSRYVTTFVTRSGLYRFTRLVFGLKTAPANFQRTMSGHFGNIKGLINYLDDFLVFAETKEEHDTIVAQVMDIMESLNLKVNLEKSVFGAKEVTFLGFKISKDGVGITEAKLEALMKMRAPKSKSELRSVLGTFNVFGRFIENLSKQEAKLRELLQKDVPFKWLKCHQDEFDNLKILLQNANVLKYFDPKDETFLMVDAGPEGLGAVLLQKENVVRRPVLCVARSLNVHEQKYCQTEKECLAIIWAMERLYMYLYGIHFKVISDCKPLQYIFSRLSTKPSPRLERWVLRYQNFDCEVIHEPGDENFSDSFSRLVKKRRTRRSWTRDDRVYR